MITRPEIKNIFEKVKTAGTDPAAGIRTVTVTGEDGMGLYMAWLGPHSRITARYPRAGIEIYPMMNGAGMLHSGVPSSGEGIAREQVRRCEKRGLFYGPGRESSRAGKYRFIAPFGIHRLPGCPYRP